MTNARVMQVATSLNSALANYDNRSVTAEKYYNKTEIDSHNTYSTSETFTGRYWVDGKKIYRKDYVESSPNTWVNVRTIDVISNLDTVINLGSIGYLGGTAHQDISVRDYRNWASFIMTSKVFCINIENVDRTYKISAFIEYTKTSD